MLFSSLRNRVLLFFPLVGAFNATRHPKRFVKLGSRFGTDRTDRIHFDLQLGNGFVCAGINSDLGRWRFVWLGLWSSVCIYCGNLRSYDRILDWPKSCPRLGGREDGGLSEVWGDRCGSGEKWIQNCIANPSFTIVSL
jgi:hypothetical protein